MPPARLVRLAPPAAWDEAALLAAARALDAPAIPVRPGDALGGLLVVGVEPAPGATLHEDTEIEIEPRPRDADGSVVELAILLDTSESMATPWSASHTRLQAARESVASFLRAPGGSVASVDLFEYAREARLVAGPAAPAALAMPPEPRPKGRAAPAAALDAALAHLAANAKPRVAQAILLLTDGVADVPALLEAGERAARLGIHVHSIVFAPETDPVFEDLARASGGTTQRAALPLTIEFEHQPGGTTS